MSKSMNMLRTRRRDNNVKPNRRLDRKSSRGMIYENEELRLKTININAEIERGQSDLKKLRRENEMLKKEIWCLRDQYNKLDQMIKDKAVDFSSTSTYSSDSESTTSMTEESQEVETSQNLENVQKTNLKNLHVEFDHLSVVPEENSTENSEKSSEKDVIKPDQGYPDFPARALHFFSPLPSNPSTSYDFYEPNTFQQTYYNEEVAPLKKTSSDIIVKLDNQSFTNGSGFSNGGNLEELLNDIETISQDILKISTSQGNLAEEPPYKSELNVVLMPTAMPLIGFENYQSIKGSLESVKDLEICRVDSFGKSENGFQIEQHRNAESCRMESFGNAENGFQIEQHRNLESCRAESFRNVQNGFQIEQHRNESGSVLGIKEMVSNLDNLCNLHESFLKDPGEGFFKPYVDTPIPRNEPFVFNNAQGKSEEFLKTEAPKQEMCSSRSNLLEPTSSDHISSENEENLRFKTTNAENSEPKPKTKSSIRRKVSIHFKGKKDKKKVDEKVEKKDELKLNKSPSLESKKSFEDKTEIKGSGSERNSQSKQRKSISISPDRKHVHLKEQEKKHKKHKKFEKLKQRRSTISTDRLNRERSFSVCTDRSNFLDNKLGLNYDDLASDREHTNSVSSCGSPRKMSNVSNFPVAGKIPWCGCWGNGCI